MKAASRTQILLARVVVALVIAFISIGLIEYGFSAGVRERVWQNLVDRPTGPMSFRFILQPIMSVIAALRDGIADAKYRRSPYFLTLLNSPVERRGRLGEGLVSTARVILLGLCMDTVYQLIEFESFYPAEAVIIAIVLAFLPYLLLRAPIARVAGLWLGRGSVEGGR